jgi:hypothetical protein
MSKRNRKVVSAYTRDESKERSRQYVTSSGLEVTLRGLPPLVPQRIDSSIEYPSKPTYDVTTASGDVETYEHDVKSLESDEDKQAWDDYLEGMNDAETELTEKLLYAVLLECVEMGEYKEEFASWKKRQKLMGIVLSEDEDENKFYFMQTEVFHDQDDIGEILTIVMNLTGVSMEELAEVRDTFPSEVESESPAGNGDTVGQSEDSGE